MTQNKKEKTIFDSMEMNAPRRCDENIYYLGIDGGGTKTAFALANSDGEVIKELRLEASNPFDVGIDRTKDVLKNGIYQVCEGIPLSSVVLFAGIAGTTAGNFYEPLKAFLGELGFAAAELDTDNENIIAAGLGKKDGITVILGTGVCCFVVRNGERHRISGWGYLFDEGGSGYNIGRDALSRYFSVCDGSEKPTSLTVAIEKSTGVDARALLTQLYKGGKRLIASYARLVIDEAKNGDAVACDILRKNMAEVSRVIRAARERFPNTDEPVSVVMTGGLTGEPLILSYLLENLEGVAPLKLEVLDVPPVEGAVRKAMYIWEEKTKL